MARIVLAEVEAAAKAAEAAAEGARLRARIITSRSDMLGCIESSTHGFDVGNVAKGRHSLGIGAQRDWQGHAARWAIKRCRCVTHAGVENCGGFVRVGSRVWAYRL